MQQGTNASKTDAGSVGDITPKRRTYAKRGQQYKRKAKASESAKKSTREQKSKRGREGGREGGRGGERARERARGARKRGRKKESETVQTGAGRAEQSIRGRRCHIQLVLTLLW